MALRNDDSFIVKFKCSVGLFVLSNDLKRCRCIDLKQNSLQSLVDSYFSKFAPDYSFIAHSSFEPISFIAKYLQLMD